MELKNIFTPWNWFKKEEESAQQVRSQALTPMRENPVVRLHQQIDQLFDEFFRGFPFSPFRRLDEPPTIGGLILPRVDIAESKKQYTITVEVPGVDEKDIDITLAEGTLTIRGEKRYEKEESDEQYHRVERSYGAFQRVISLPTDADEDKVEAKFKNGVLTITVGKNPNAKPPVRKIAIK
ncbi:MAG: Hsp20/alpha crystallin family protein [Nitrospirae bacterium]|nr:MAG: Hsp20/alpha crystallin family protein [Nitrospirota bacterium]